MLQWKQSIWDKVSPALQAPYLKPSTVSQIIHCFKGKPMTICLCLILSLNAYKVYPKYQGARWKFLLLLASASSYILLHFVSPHLWKQQTDQKTRTVHVCVSACTEQIWPPYTCLTCKTGIVVCTFPKSNILMPCLNCRHQCPDRLWVETQILHRKHKMPLHHSTG